MYGISAMEEVRKQKTESGEISPIQKGGLSYIITKTNRIVPFTYIRFYILLLSIVIVAH